MPADLPNLRNPPASSIFFDELVLRYLPRIGRSFRRTHDESLQASLMTIHRLAAYFGMRGLSNDELADEMAHPTPRSVLVIADNQKSVRFVEENGCRYLLFVGVLAPRSCAYRTCLNLLTDEYREERDFEDLKRDWAHANEPDRRCMGTAGNADDGGDNDFEATSDNLSRLAIFHQEVISNDNVRELKEVLFRCLRETPRQEHRQLLTLIFNESMTCREARELLGIKENTAKSILLRFHLRVRQEFLKGFQRD